MITLNLIRDCLDRMGVPSRVNEDGDLVVHLDADDEFGHDVIVLLIVEKGKRLSFIAGAPEYDPQGDLYYMANRHNSRRYFPTAVIRNGTVRMEYSFLISEEVSEEYLRETCLRHTMAAIWTAFSEFEQESIE